MHQQSRHPPRAASPASNPQTNPSRTNNPRDSLGASARPRSGSEAMAAQDGGPTAADAGDGFSSGAGPEAASGPSRETVKKLDQIIQNFHYKAAVVIVQSRISASASGARRSEPKKANKWFQLDTDDIDDFRDELRVWKTSGSFENRPPPMIIETYLDASQLAHGQSLVVVDDNGKRWDVLEALNTSESSSDGSNRSQRRTTEIVLERWRIELRCIPSSSADDFAPILPTIYKRAIVFFRSLFTATRALPAWRYAQHVQTKGVHPALAVKCRFYTMEPEYSPLEPDLLRHPLFDGREAVTDYMFGDLEVPVGRLSASVTYRNDVHFRVDDSESLLSSRFMGVDEHLFRPSIPAPQRREHGRRDSYAEVGSVPSSGHYGRAAAEPQQTYGSLSTFHGEGALATSPLTALKAVRAVGSDTNSPPGSVPASGEPDPSHSLPIRGPSRQAIRGVEGMARRPSVSFQPFKAGSLSASPRPGDEPPASPQSRPATLSGLSHTRNRSSLTAEMAALRGTPPPAAAGPTDIPPVVGSPKPTSRYSSSFTHRRGRLSFGGQSKGGDDDAGSSGNRSLSSSAQPGSGLLAEAGGAASSGSFQTDDDISEFLKVLDSKKTLASFEPAKKGESSTAKRTNAQLSRFQLMRDSNNALTESMTSSMQLHRSSSSSSRQLHNVPGMVNPASMSVSSSPGKPLSPHTPHTPAIPSRLSENSIIDYQAPGRRPRPEVLATEEELDEPVSQQGTTPMDIPLSPRLLHTSGNRRSSSVALQHRLSGTGAGEDDSDLVQRSVSLGADDREAPTLSTLLALQGANDSVSPTSGLQPAVDIRPTSSSAEREAKSASPSGGLAPPYRLRYGSGARGGAGRATPPQSAKGSFSGGRYPGMLNRAGEDGADEEPLVFAMSELERDSRRSLEEGRAGSASGMGSGQGRAFEPRGTTKRGW